MEVPLQRPTFDHEEEQAVVEVLRSGWVTQGPKVAEFENDVAAFVGAQHAVALTSATTALHASLLAIGIESGDEVICPSYTYIATPNSIVHAGGTPVFADLDADSWSISLDAIEAAITPKTKAIMPVHMGYPADIDGLYVLAAKHDLLVVEDAAPAIGAHYKDLMVGNSDGPVVFSFHPRKTITTGEGGMVTTNDESIAAKLRLLRHHYMSITDLARHHASATTFEEYDEVGYNLRMTDLQAAVGIAQLKKLDAILADRIRMAAAYDRAFADLPIRVPHALANTTHTYQNYSMEILPDSRQDRNAVMEELNGKGITTRRGIMSSHLEPAYIRRFGRVSLPVSEHVSATTVMLPIFKGMTNEEQQYVIEAVRTAVL